MFEQIEIITSLHNPESKTPGLYPVRTVLARPPLDPVSSFWAQKRPASTELTRPKPLAHSNLSNQFCPTKHCLVVDGLGVGGHGSFLEGLGKCGVGVTGSGNILAGSTVLESQSTFSNHLTSVRADDVNAKNTVGLRVSEHLDHTLSILVGLGSGVGDEGEASNPATSGDSLLLSLVCKHRAKGDITNTSDVGDLGSVLGVDNDTAAVVVLKTDVLEAEASSHLSHGAKGSYTYGLGFTTLGGVNLKLDLVAGLVTTHDLGVELEFETLLLEDLLGVLGDLIVHTRSTNLTKELDDGDLGTQSDLFEGNGTSAGDDALLIDLEPGERSSLRSSGNEDVFTTDAGLTALVEVDLNLMLAGERSGTLDVFDTVLLEKVLDTLGEAGNGGFLGLHEVGQVELDFADLDSAGLGVMENLVVKMRVV
ncbi:hypothetical protein HG530_015457 [Fusarium avenaceum]|nr:hypothetical protein HG530_015457 [Fusarium avenaceum]